MATSHLAVLLRGRPVADLVRTRSRALRLTYADDARTPGSTPLSLSLPLDSPSHAGEPVETFLRALVPESPGALAAIARRHRVDATDVLDVLSVIGQDCAGAVQFCAADEVDDVVARPGRLEPCSDAEIEARLDEMDVDEDASWTMPGEHWSLGGTQQKFALHRAQDGWFVAHGAQPTTHIVKPGIRRMRAQALTEHVSMRAARILGLDVAETAYQSFKSREAIVVTRFDRHRGPDGTVTRLHQEDLAQALGAREKYEELGGPSAADVVRLLRDRSATRAQAEANVRRFVDGVVFSSVTGAPDAHARNYAVLLEGDEVRLAPLYDIATGLAHAVSPGAERVLSMSVGGTFRLDELDREAWRRFAGRIRVDEQALVARVDELTDGAPAAFAEALRTVGPADDVDRFADELAPRIADELDARANRSRPT